MRQTDRRSKASRRPRPTGIAEASVAAPSAKVPPSTAQPASIAAVMKMGMDASGNVANCPPPEEFDTSKPMLMHLGGSKSDHWNQMLCNQIIRSGWFRESMPDAERQDQYTAILAFLAGVKPTDAVEGMMAAQLYASHAAAMECYRRAMLPGQPLEARQVQLSLAAKLTKANATQVEALKRYRSKGEQKVVVEHVHVHAGGQAIVGQVTPGGPRKISEAQPHAIGYAERPPVRCEDEEQKRKALPIAGNA